MLDLAFTSLFKRDMKRKRKQGADLAKIDAAITALRKGEALPASNRDHELSGVYRGHRECRIEPDWPLICRVDRDKLVLTAVRTGSHSDLLGLWRPVRLGPPAGHLRQPGVVGTDPAGASSQRPAWAMAKLRSFSMLQYYNITIL